MATQVQLRRGTTVQHSTFTGAIAEVTYDTDKKTLIVHDGSTAGGYEVAISDGAGSFTTGAFSSDVTITGNLTVNGTTTTVNSNTVNIGDNIIVLNSDETGTPSQNAGIEIERGTSTNRSIIWNETTNKWTLTNDGSSYSNILIASDIGSSVQEYDANNVVSDASSTFSADQNFGDNVKAIFGAGSDLQIYHTATGNHSIINESGGGDLQIQANKTVIQSASGADDFLVVTPSAGVQLSHNASGTVGVKLATTSTGIDVTGTVTADGLTVTGTLGNTIIQPSGAEVHFSRNGNNDILANGGTSADLTLGANRNINFKTGASLDQEMIILANGNVGIGTTSPNSPLEVSNGAENHRVAFGTGEVYLMARNASSYITQEYIANQHVFTGYGDNSSNEGMRIDSSGNVGIGTSSPSQKFHVEDTTASNTSTYIQVVSGNAGNAGIAFGDSDTDLRGGILYNNNDDALRFFKAGFTEAGRFDSSGNLLVGKTSAGASSVGFEARANGFNAFTRDGSQPLEVRRLTSDGVLIDLRKDSTSVGSIFSSGGIQCGIGAGDTALLFADNINAILPWNSNNSARDNALDLGRTSTKFKDGHFAGTLYAGRGIGSTQTAGGMSGNSNVGFNTYQNFVFTLTGPLTLLNGNFPAEAGQTGFIIFKQDGTGGRTVSLGTGYLTAGGAGLTLSSAANAIDMVPYVFISSTECLLGTPQLAFA